MAPTAKYLNETFHHERHKQLAWAKAASVTETVRREQLIFAS